MTRINAEVCMTIIIVVRLLTLFWELRESQYQPSVEPHQRAADSGGTTTGSVLKQDNRGLIAVRIGCQMACADLQEFLCKKSWMTLLLG